MIYGSSRPDGSKINADPPIDEKKALGMRQNTIQKYLSFAPHPSPHLDTGCGIDFARRYMPAAVTTDVDLDVSRLPFRANYFRTVTSFEIIEHLYNPLHYLMEVGRVLRLDGVLYLTTPDDWSLIYRINHLRRRKYAPHFHQFTEFDLRQIMARAGFEIVRLERYTRGGSGTLARISMDNFFLVCRASSD